MALKEGKKKFFQRSQEYLLYLLIFLLPWQTRWMFKPGELQGEYWEYNTYSLYFVDVLAFISLLLILLSFQKVESRKLKVKSYLFWWLVGGFELFIFISIFFAADKLLAGYGYIRFLLGVGLFFLLINIKYDKIKMYWAIVAAGLLQSILGIHQFFSQQVYANKWLGMALQYPSEQGVSVVATDIRRFLRAYGSLPHPNILGGFLVVCLLVNILLYFNLFYKWRRSGATSPSRDGEKKYKIGILLSLVFFTVNFFGLLLTFSRGAWLGLAAGLIILFPAVWEKHKKDGLIILAKFIFILAIISGFFAWQFKEPVFSRFDSGNRLKNKSTIERIEYRQDAKQIINNHWLFGAGIKNYGLAVHSEADSERAVFKYEPAHNVFLLIWAETGIFGLLFFISLLVYCFISLLKRHSYGKMSLIMALAVMMMFDHWIWTLSFGVFLFWTVLGLSLKKF